MVKGKRDKERNSIGEVDDLNFNSSKIQSKNLTTHKEDKLKKGLFPKQHKKE